MPDPSTHGPSRLGASTHALSGHASSRQAPSGYVLSTHPLAPAALVALRMLIGWHFLYEGIVKAMQPAWTLTGRPLAAWSAAGYLQAASGPFSGWFHALAQPSLIAWVDRAVILALVLIGLSLLLGLFTQTGAIGAASLLSLFYLAAMPLGGVPQPGQEGTYLMVNKTLIELGAVLVILACRTGRIAGLDLLHRRPLAPTRSAASRPATLG